MQKPFVIAGVGAALLVAVLLGAFMLSTGGGASATRSQFVAAENASSRPATVSAAEANAWAEARAADTKGAYGVYLAAFPEGAFVDDAREAMDRVAVEREERREKVRVAASGAAPRRHNVAAACRNYVDQKLSQPSRVGRTVGGAAAGCAVGALAGGNDGRNCAVGAVAGGVTGAVSAESRERR
ncbi:MAG: hypothetical protein FD124_3558, partial [Alphaproteobacteria bacterium]